MIAPRCARCRKSLFDHDGDGKAKGCPGFQAAPIDPNIRPAYRTADGKTVRVPKFARW